MNQPELEQITAMFDQTLVEFADSIWELTELYDEGRTPTEEFLTKHIRYVANRREKLILCAKAAQLNYGQDLHRSIPMLHMHGGIC